jgi:hypothetical protein
MSHRSDVPSQFHLLMFFSTSNDGEALTLTDHQLAPQISSSGLPVTCVPVTSYTDFAAVFPSCYSHLSLEVQKHEQIGRPGTSQPLCQCRPASWAPFSPNCPSPPKTSIVGQRRHGSENCRLFSLGPALSPQPHFSSSRKASWRTRLDALVTHGSHGRSACGAELPRS